MPKAYVITLNNGLSYDDQEIKPVAVCLSREDANKFIKENSPVSNEMFKKIFYTSIQYYMDGIELGIDEVDLIKYD